MMRQYFSVHLVNVFFYFQMGYKHQFEVGRWLGVNYRNIFGSIYSQKNIHILSSNTSRTILSAKAALSGVFPELQIHDTGILNLELLGKNEDNLILLDKPCNKLNELKGKVLELEPFLSKSDNVFYEYLRNFTYFPIYNTSWAFYLYDTLESESKQNLSLPEWTTNVYPQKFQQDVKHYYLLKTYNSDVARLEVGPLWNRILSFFKDLILNYADSPKVFFISAHQHTLVNILNTMKAYDDTPPSFSSSIIFELHEDINHNFYIETLFKNDTDFIKVNFANCSSKCNLGKVFNILGSLSISQKEWEYECNLKKFSISMGSIIFVIILSSFVIFVIVYISIQLNMNGKKAFFLLGQVD